MKLIYLLLLLVLVSATTTSAITASIGNAKMIINTEVVEGQTTIIERSIKVINDNEVPVNISLELNGDLVEIAELAEENFVLQPYESKAAWFVIRLDYGGRYEGKVGVSFLPLEGGQGVGLASKIIILAEGPENPNKTNETIIPEESIPDEEKTVDDIIDKGNNTVTVRPTKAPPKEPTKTENSASPIIGGIIILVILAIGGVLYFLTKRG